MKDINIFIMEEYKEQIKSILLLFNTEGNHVLLSSVDVYILDTMKKIIHNRAIDIGLSVYYKYYSELSNRVIILDDRSHITDIMLYNLFEYSRKKKRLYFFFLSTNSNVIEDMEKRVRSRFNNNIIFFPYISYRALNNVFNISEEEYINIPMIEYYIRNKYKYKIDKILNILKPSHIILLIISNNINIKYNNIICLFYKFTSDIPEIRKTRNINIIESFYDILELELIDFRGRLNIDYEILYNFIQKNSKQYIKNIIKK